MHPKGIDTVQHAPPLPTAPVFGEILNTFIIFLLSDVVTFDAAACYSSHHQKQIYIVSQIIN